MTIRTVIHMAINEGWSMGSFDVTGAFLQAPRRGSSEPPSILRPLGLTKPGGRNGKFNVLSMAWWSRHRIGQHIVIAVWTR